VTRKLTIKKEHQTTPKKQFFCGICQKPAFYAWHSSSTVQTLDVCIYYNLSTSVSLYLHWFPQNAPKLPISHHFLKTKKLHFCAKYGRKIT